MQETTFAALATLADRLAQEGSRLKKRAAIADELSRIVSEPPADGASDDDLQRALQNAGLFCLYLAGQSFAEADPRKLNAGGALLTRALLKVANSTEAELSIAYRRHGDLGAAAFDLLQAGETLLQGKQAEVGPSQSTLTLADVAAAFDTIATARTTAIRSATVEALLRRSTPLEAKYLLKLMLGDMRIGVKQSLIEEAIAVASSTEATAVRHAVMLEADLAQATGRAFAGTLAEARMRLFHPLGFMLASPVDTPEEAMERFTEKPSRPDDGKAPAKKKAKRRADPAATDEAFPDAPTPVALEAANAAEQAYSQEVAREAEALDIETATPASKAYVAAYLEDKFDGMRAQIHCGDPAQPGRVAIYSRNREEITASFPEIVEALQEVIEQPGGIMLDGELLGWDLAAGTALPFAILGQRIGRKRVDEAMRRAVPVVFMAFDLLFEQGELLLPLPLRQRRERLESLFARISPQTTATIEPPRAQGGLFADTAAAEPVQRLMLSSTKLVESAEAIHQAYADARARANEGVMLKAAESAYLPGRRGLAWLKLKRELSTLDVVMTGAEFGHGRRAGLLSDYTFAVRGTISPEDPQGRLLNIGKAYSGVTDAEIAELTAWLKEHTLEDHGHYRTVEPLRVLEVAFNNIMRSDRHASGFALRFPRILRIRDDKPVEEIDTIERVEEIYQSQPDKVRDVEDAEAAVEPR
jgi:DNA ligase-1